MIRIVKVGVVCDSLVWLGVVWYGLVKILKLKSKPLMNGRGYVVGNGRGYGVIQNSE